MADSLSLSAIAAPLEAGSASQNAAAAEDEDEAEFERLDGCGVLEASLGAEFGDGDFESGGMGHPDDPRRLSISSVHSAASSALSAASSAPSVLPSHLLDDSVTHEQSATMLKHHLVVRPPPAPIAPALA